MVMGLIGGSIENDIISIHKAKSASIGNSNNVALASISNADMEQFHLKLKSNNMSIFGWYCSMIPGRFYCETNRQTQSSWQRLYAKALVFVVFPQYLIDRNYKDFIKILRLKDFKSNDFSEKNWIEFTLNIIDSDQNLFFHDLTSKWAEIKDVLNMGKMELISKYFNEWGLFDFEEKNKIITMLDLDIVLDN